MKRYLLFILILIPSISFAAPVVTNVSDTTLEDGQILVTITGTGFDPSEQGLPTVYKWDDFEGATHTLGSPVGDGPGSYPWFHIGGVYGNYATVNNSTNRTGSTKYAQQTYIGTGMWRGGIAIDYGFAVSPIYATYYTNWSGTITGSNIKLQQPIENTEHYYKDPSIDWTFQPGYDHCGIINDEEARNYNWVTGNGDMARTDTDEWVRAEAYGVQSSVGSANGTVIWSSQKSENGSFVTIMSYIGNVCTRYVAGTNWNSFALGEYANSTNTLRMDDIYLANSRARVEIGESTNATFSSNTHREIQIPTSWNDNSITFTVNQGSFSAGSAHLFVIDSSGVASIGYDISFSSDSGSTTTAASTSSTTTSIPPIVTTTTSSTTSVSTTTSADTSTSTSSVPQASGVSMTGVNIQ